MKKARILIVEDEAVVALELKKNLENMGHRVVAIADAGHRVIEKVREEIPDVILMDIRLKGDSDGIETAQWVRSQFDKEIPIIFATAYLDEERLERAKNLMPFGYVLKPIQERDLKVAIEMALYVARIVDERRKAETTYRNLFLNSQIGLFRTDLASGRLLDGNDSLARFLGYPSREALLAESVNIIERYVDPLDRDRLVGPIRQCGEVKDFEARFTKKDGSIIWMRSSAKLVPDQGWIEGVSQDITNEKRMLQALRDSEEKYRKVVDNSIEAICVLQDELFAYFNPEAVKLFGYPAAELKSCRRWKPSTPKIERWCWEGASVASKGNRPTASTPNASSPRTAASAGSTSKQCPSTGTSGPPFWSFCQISPNANDRRN